MDVRYINPFLNATINVLKTMAFMDLTPEKPFLKENHVGSGDVTGIIGLTGQVTGSLSVSFSFELIQKVMHNMLGEEIREINDGARDAVGEITNMISGDARRQLQQEGLNLKAAIPTVVAGKGHTIKHLVAGPIIVIPFTAEKGRVTVEVSLKG